MEEQIIALVKRKGPIVPSDLTSDLRIDSLFAGAYLSDLVKNKKLIVSSVKFGSSPLYLLPEQKSMLENFSKNLNEKNKRAFDLLKERKIVKDKDLNPLLQVAMREIKDYAIPLKVNNSEIFWKYFLTSDEEAKLLIRNILELQQKKETPEVNVKPAKQETVEKKTELKAVSETPVQEIIKKETSQLPKPEPITDLEKELRKQMQLELKKEKERIKTIIEEELKLHLKKEKTEIVTSKDTLRKLEPEEISDEFFQKVFKKLNQINIKIIDVDIVSRNKEYDLIVEVPSVIGNLKYYAKMQNKPKINEADLSTAYIKSLQKNLPTLFLSNGTLNKKADAMIGKEFKNLIFQKII